MVIDMDRVAPQPVKDPPNLIRLGAFSLDRLLSHIDPGTEEESEEFVRRILLRLQRQGSSLTRTSPALSSSGIPNSRRATWTLSAVLS